MAAFSTHGQHVIMDVWEVAFERLDDLHFLRTVMYEAAKLAGAEVVGERFVKFTPQGLTGVLVLSESHLSIHTYPEAGFIAVDCYTCGPHCDPLAACMHLCEALNGRIGKLIFLRRGVADEG